MTLLIFSTIALLAIPLIPVLSRLLPGGTRSVQLEVFFKLTDPDYQPLAGVPIRLLIGSDKNWQNPGSGYRFFTDARGEGHVIAQVLLDRRWRKMPSSFWGTLLGLPLLTDHLAAGAEMPYMSYRWVYLVDTILFPEGTSMQDHFSVYSCDSQGQFTNKALETENGWSIQELKGLMLSSPGYAPWDYTLGHDKNGENWTLKLCFKRFPPAIQR